MTNGKMLAVLDIGKTWINGAVASQSAYKLFLDGNRKQQLETLFGNTAKVRSSFCSETREEDIIQELSCFLNELCHDQTMVEGIAISFGGMINYHGDKVDLADDHFRAFKEKNWKSALEEKYRCPVVLANNADAAAMGMAELNHLHGWGTTGILVLDAGLGFSIWKNGRRWRPGGRFPLLGSVRFPDADYNQLVSTSLLENCNEQKDLCSVFRDVSCHRLVDGYLDDLGHVIFTAVTIYGLDEICITGALADAALEAQYDLEGSLSGRLAGNSHKLAAPTRLRVIAESKYLRLLGAFALIAGDNCARSLSSAVAYHTIETELPYDGELMLQQKTASELVKILWQAEEEAGRSLSKSLTSIGDVAERVFQSLSGAGRLIYVGAGTSGRIAALDAVEIPCTYGLPADKAIALVAGGIAEASIEIEYQSEEDASSVPEMLLINISTDDVVIGISASGSAYFVQSALAVAKARGAYTVMIRNAEPPEVPRYCDTVISLHSGYEVVAGSTRMKAGTATKKVLNFISSAAMMRLGKVRGSYMIDVACFNSKLTSRATQILHKIYGLREEDGMRLLRKNEYSLKKAILEIEAGGFKIQR